MADEQEKAEGAEEQKPEEAAAEVTEEKSEETPAEEAKEEKKEEAKEEPKEEPKEEKKEEKKPEPSGKFKELIKQVEEMSVLELSELVKTLEDRFGVSAAAPVAVAGAGGAAADGAEEAAEEKTAYTVHITASGGNKIAVIKAVREVNNTLGLKEAKDLVDAAPADVRKDVPKDEANTAKEKLEAAGATVELK
jgi:large subunit ribosomal protein L7/L12